MSSGDGNTPVREREDMREGGREGGREGRGAWIWWNGNSGMVERWNGFFSRSFCLLVCVLTEYITLKQRSVQLPA